MNRTIKSLWLRDSGDSYGECLGMFFAVAELLWALGQDIPAEWGFHPSPLSYRAIGAWAHHDRAKGQWPDGDLCEMYLEGLVTDGELLHAGNVLNRYTRLLKLAGKDY